MANHCWNHISIFDFKSREDKRKVEEWLYSYEDFNYFVDWAEALLSPENQIKPTKDDFHDYYRYGTKWLDFGNKEHEFYGLTIDDDSIMISGDSAWGPPTALMQCISKEFGCTVEMEYNESGMDFSGTERFEDGEQIESWEGTYREGLYLLEEGVHSLEREIEWACEDPECAAQFLKECKRFVTKEDYNTLTKAVTEFLNEQELEK